MTQHGSKDDLSAQAEAISPVLDDVLGLESVLVIKWPESRPAVHVVAQSPLSHFPSRFS